MSEKKEKYVYKRKDGRWEARYLKGYTESGKRSFGVVYGDSADEVIQKRHDLIEKVDKDEAVDLLPMPELVDFAERGVFSSAGVEEYISRTLGKFYQDNKRDFDDYSVVVLGCTHFNHFIPMLKPFFDEGMSFIDGSLGTVKNLKHITEERGFSSSGEFSLTVYESGRNVSGTEREAFYREALEHLKGITD